MGIGPIPQAREKGNRAPGLANIVNLTAQIEGFEWIILLIIVAALFLFGPQKLPELARGFGRAMGEFRRGRREVEKEITRPFGTAAADARPHEQRAAEAVGVTTASPTTGVREQVLKAVDARRRDP